AGFTTFSNILFDDDYDSDSIDDQSLSVEDVREKIYSNPLFDEEIIPMEIDQHSFNAKSDLIESMPNHDSSITISSKIGSLFDEFAGELTLLKSFPPGIDETDCHPEKEIRLTKRLLDSTILEELLDNYSLSLPENESCHCDIPSPYRPPTKPPDGKTGTLNIKMLGDVSDQKIPIPNLTITRVLNQEKSPDLLSHQGLEAFQPSAECPMSINGKNIPLSDGLANLADIFVDSTPEMFTDEHALDYSSPLIFGEYDDDLLEVDSDAGNVYDDPFDSKGEKIKEYKLFVDELDLPCDFLPSSEYNSFISQDFSRVDALPSTNNEDKIFNPDILIQEKPVKIITRVVQDKKLAISNASLVLENFDPPFYEPLFFKEVPKSKMLLPFSSENEEKVFKPGIHTSEKVHSYFIPELSHRGYKVFKINQIFKSLMKIFLFHCGKDTHILVVPYHHVYPLDQFKYGGIGSSSAT
nr:hypothetical protein [Tanacetum cinerariifolium]